MVPPIQTGHPFATLLLLRWTPGAFGLPWIIEG